MTILLVRHAESVGNADEDVYGTVADHVMNLTARGEEQARALGVFLKDWYHANPPKNQVRLWCSPYKRTLWTVQGMRDTMGDWAWNKCGRGRDIHFDDRLRERDWGYYRVRDYHENGKLQRDSFDMYTHYKQARQAPMGRYFARPYGGESMADVADRMRSFYHDLYFDIQRGVTDHLIVMHAGSMLALTYAFTKIHPHFMTDEKIAENTGVRLLDIDPATNRYADFGMVYNPQSNVYLTNRPAHPVQRDMSVILAALS